MSYGECNYFISSAKCIQVGNRLPMHTTPMISNRFGGKPHPERGSVAGLSEPQGVEVLARRPPSDALKAGRVARQSKGSPP